MHNPRPKRRLRVSPAQAKDIQNLARVSETIHERNVMLEAMFAKLNRIWQAGVEDRGVAEDGTVLYRRIMLLQSIRGEGEEYPDVRVVIDQMPEPGTPDAGVVQ